MENTILPYFLSKILNLSPVKNYKHAILSPLSNTQSNLSSIQIWNVHPPPGASKSRHKVITKDHSTYCQCSVLRNESHIV